VYLYVSFHVSVVLFSNMYRSLIASYLASTLSIYMSLSVYLHISFYVFVGLSSCIICLFSCFCWSLFRHV